MNQKIKMDNEVMNALAHTFNSDKVVGLSNEQYKQYIEACTALTLNTLMKNEGVMYVKDFCEAALNSTEAMPIVQQAKPH